MNELQFNSSADLHAHYTAVLARTRGVQPQGRSRHAVARPQAAIADGRAGRDEPGLLEGVSAPIDMLRTRGCKFLISYVAAKTGVSIEEIIGPVQSKPLVAARHAAMAMCFTHTRHSVVKIGAALNKDHTTVSYVIGKYKLKRGGTTVHLRGKCQNVFFNGEYDKLQLPITADITDGAVQQ